jgi:4-nitrophenyl phosphatase
MPESKIAAVVLAAGGSSRFGEPKQLLTWEGRPLVAHIADIAWSAGLDPVLVVVGAAADDVLAALGDRPVQVVRNYRWEAGLSSSLSLGVAALPPDVDGALFLPVDQPLITPALLQRIVRHGRELDAGIVVPRTAEGRRGNPVFFDRAFFPELAALSGDVGGRVLLDRYPERVSYLPVEDAQLLADADTPRAYERLAAYAAAQGGTLDFSRIRGLICDMDGVLWRGSTALPGLKRFFQMIRDHHLEHVLVTNNSSRTPDQYVRKLAGMGIETTVDHVLNSAIAAARYVAEEHPGAVVYAIGGAGVKQALETHGLVYCDDPEVSHVDVVVVGWDRQLTWQKLATATRLILDGAAFVGTNPDRTFPMETALAPGNGAQTAALEAATDVTPVIAGKPAPLLYRQAMARMGTDPEQTLVIGDRLDTDILGGIRLGMPTALVLTGISQEDALSSSPIRPTAVFEHLPALVAAWRQALTERK